MSPDFFLGAFFLTVLLGFLGIVTAVTFLVEKTKVSIRQWILLWSLSGPVGWIILLIWLATGAFVSVWNSLAD